VGEYAEPRVAANGRSLVFALNERLQSLTRIAVGASAAIREVPVTDGHGGDLDPSIAPGGDRLVFSSARSGDRHLWTTRLDGTEPRPLTSGAVNDDRPAFSPDGRQIAFISDRGGRRAIWLISADGGALRKLADTGATGGLSWSPDGMQIVYAASGSDWPALWSVSVADGTSRRIATPGAVGEPAWSPKRDLIAYLSPTTTGATVVSLAFVDSRGAPQYTTLPTVPPVPAGFSNGMPAWSSDGTRLAIVSQNSNGTASIWLIEPASATASFRKLIEFPIGPRIRGLTWTPDGSAIVVGKHDTTSDIVFLDQLAQGS